VTHTARDSFVLGLNRANLQAMISYLLERLSLSKADAKLEVLKRPLLSLQGPKASQALSSIAHCDLTSMQYGDFTLKTIAGADCMVWRRGFVGEDDFEISPSDQASASVIQSALEQHPAVKVTHVDEEEQWLVEDCLRV
jgi:glycine cleavage system aminomethyltransferase T